MIDIMLLGHWIEMKSVIGASRALEELQPGDKVLVKPGEKISVDGFE